MKHWQEGCEGRFEHAGPVRTLRTSAFALSLYSSRIASMGSTEAARPAGKINAKVKTASNTASVASAMSGLPALYAIKQRLQEAAGSRSQGCSCDDARQDTQRGSARQRGDDLLASRAERHADADLAAAFGDRARKDAIQSGSHQSQGEQCESAGDAGEQTLAAQVVTDRIAEQVSAWRGCAREDAGERLTDGGRRQTRGSRREPRDCTRRRSSPSSASVGE